MLPENLFVMSKNGVPVLVSEDRQWLMDNGTLVDVKWLWLETMQMWIATDTGGNNWTIRETLVVPK